MHGVTASSSRFPSIHISDPLFVLGGGGVSCTVRHDRCGASHCSRRSCGVIDTSFRSSCSRFSVSWAQQSSLDSAFFPAFFSCFPSGPVSVHGGGVSDIPGQFGSPAVLLGVFSQLPGSFLIGVSHFSDSGSEVLRSSSPWRPPFIVPLGRDVSGSAEPALVLYALGTEHLPRCSHMDAILRFVR